MKKKLSCGVILKLTGKYLIVHPTGGDHWSIPKGVQEEHETPLQCAKRELFEETNIKISDSLLMLDLGRYKYLRNKDLYLFFIELDRLDVELKCNSHVGSRPEIDKYAWVGIQGLLTHVNFRQRTVIEQVIKDI
jgi:8-oxo-dGTP pyrophosphatase MutT (NUDIX family)